jgi:hypothetical protein
MNGNRLEPSLQTVRNGLSQSHYINSKPLGKLINTQYLPFSDKLSCESSLTVKT